MPFINREKAPVSICHRNSITILGDLTQIYDIYYYVKDIRVRGILLYVAVKSMYLRPLSWAAARNLLLYFGVNPGENL